MDLSCDTSHSPARSAPPQPRASLILHVGCQPSSQSTASPCQRRRRRSCSRGLECLEVSFCLFLDSGGDPLRRAFEPGDCFSHVAFEYRLVFTAGLQQQLPFRRAEKIADSSDGLGYGLNGSEERHFTPSSVAQSARSMRRNFPPCARPACRCDLREALVLLHRRMLLRLSRSCSAEAARAW